MPSSLWLLIDDVAGVLDDVATMTTLAAKKTAGVVGDDLALNARQVAGVASARELAVVWRVACGSAFNKLLLVPAALAIGGLAAWAVTPLLVAGGAYLCFEGVEKLLHGVRHRTGGHHPAGAGDPAAPAEGASAGEGARIAGAIRTDFILSAEIVVITLGVVAGRPLVTQLAVLLAIAFGMTIGVYGLVAAIVKIDDAGLFLANRPEPAVAAVGRGIIAVAPWLMRGLSVAGTAAMFLVGGGIVAHAVPAVHHAVHDLAARLPGATRWVGPLSAAAEALVGIASGIAVMAASSLVRAARAPTRGGTR